MFTISHAKLYMVPRVSAVAAGAVSLSEAYVSFEQSLSTGTFPSIAALIASAESVIVNPLISTRNGFVMANRAIAANDPWVSTSSSIYTAN
jgi:hypothetical protein